MALNIKLATIICLTFIGGVSWTIQQAALPEAEYPPLGSRGPALAGVVSGTREAAFETDELGQPVNWTGRFARPSPLEVEAERNRRLSGALLVAVPPRDAPEPATLRLPPMVGGRSAPWVIDDGMPTYADQGGDAGSGTTLVAGDAASASTNDQPATSAAVAHYVAQKGDSANRIARKMWNSEEARLVRLLIEANPDVAKRGGRILAGEELVIPDPHAPATVAHSEPTNEPRAAGRGEPGRLADRAERGKPGQTTTLRAYTIKSRDSLESIAARELKDARRWREILELNRSLNPSKIVPGTRIKLPPADRLARR